MTTPLLLSLLTADFCLALAWAVLRLHWRMRADIEDERRDGVRNRLWMAGR